LGTLMKKDDRIYSFLKNELVTLVIGILDILIKHKIHRL